MCVLIVNPNAEVVVLPGLTFVGKLVPVAAISVAIEDMGPPNKRTGRIAGVPGGLSPVAG